MDEKLKKALEDLKGELQLENESRWTGFQKELESLRERDTAPDDTKVLDLEKRMEDKDREIADLTDKIRLLKVGTLVPPNDGRQAKPDFKGVFLPRITEIREAMRQAPAGAQLRALDTSLFTGGGDLQPETADAFIDLLIDQTTTLSRITTMRMTAPDRNLDELKISTRQIVASVEGTAPTVADAVSTAQHALATVSVIWPEDITLRFLEDNIERGGVEAHIARMIARQFGNDLNDLAWNGDGSTADNFHDLNEGFSVLFLADADVNDVDLTAETTAPGCLSSIIRGMPQQFLATPDLVFFAPVGFCQYYADAVAARETAQGDDVMLNGFPNLRYFGRRVIPEPHLNDTTAGVDTDELITLAPASMLVNGIQRDIRVDAQWNGRKRAVEYTLTARVDVEYVDGEIIVRGHSLPAALK